MCGIFGAISLGGMKTVKIEGKQTLVPKNPWDISIVKGLAWANRERGTDSLGFFDSSGRMVKRASDPSEALQDEKVRRWVAMSRHNSWAIGGHTRYATQGSVNKANAHPFKYGHIIGSHNGMVHAPQQYTVDSEYLFDVIREHGYKGLENVRGYWGLTWFDLHTHQFFLTKHTGSVYYAVQDGVCYYSSSDKHLSTFVEAPVKDLKEGQVLRFNENGVVEDSEDGKLEGIKVSTDYWSNNWEGWEGGRYCNSYSGTGTTSYPKTGRSGSRLRDTTGTNTSGASNRTYGQSSTTGSTSTSRSVVTSGAPASAAEGSVLDDWDGKGADEWNEAWDKYFHAMSDDEFKAWESMT